MSANPIEETAFPTFDDEQMESVGAIGELVAFANDDELISQGQKDYPFYVIKSGEVRIVEMCGPKEVWITSHGPRSMCFCNQRRDVSAVGTTRLSRI